MAKKDINDLLKETFISIPEDNTSMGSSVEGRSNEILMKVLDKAFTTEDIELKTDLTTNQIVQFARARRFADQFSIDVLNKFIYDLSVYSVSKDRKGRKEYVEIAKSLHNMEHEQQEGNIRDRLLGKTF